MIMMNSKVYFYFIQYYYAINHAMWIERFNSTAGLLIGGKRHEFKAQGISHFINTVLTKIHHHWKKLILGILQ